MNYVIKIESETGEPVFSCTVYAVNVIDALERAALELEKEH